MLSIKTAAYDSGVMYIPQNESTTSSLKMVVSTEPTFEGVGHFVSNVYRVDDEDVEMKDDIYSTVLAKLRVMGFTILSRGRIFSPTKRTLGNILNDAIEQVGRETGRDVKLYHSFNFYNSIIYDGNLQPPMGYEFSKLATRTSTENAIATAILHIHGKSKLSTANRVAAIACVRKNLFY